VSATVDPTKLPFKEAIEFFRNKHDRPIEKYTHMEGGIHDRAFMVAAVMKQAVLVKLQAAVSKAIAEGTTQAEFNKDFAASIESQWEPKQSRAWRARVVYETNLRTSYAAGRYKQLTDMKDTHPYWQYKHGGSRSPRQEHLALDGVVVRADDPWWDTHYPPNGWNCTCYVRALSYDDVRRMGLSVTESPKPMDGLDEHWAYAPGASVARGGAQGGEAQHALRRLSQLEPDIAAKAVDAVGPALAQHGEAEWRGWAQSVLDYNNGGRQGPFPQSAEARVLCDIGSTLLEECRKVGLDPDSAGVHILGEGVLHLKIPRKVLDGTALTDAEILRLFEIMNRPEAVLWERGTNNLLFVFPEADPAMRGKVVVEVRTYRNVRENGKKAKRLLNAVISGGHVPLHVLESEKAYKMLIGWLRCP
jgi:SPP1 gp7 family putative phage head morphogenesis protein